MIKHLRYVTDLNKKDTRKVIFWEILHNFFVAAPTGILLAIIWELFLVHPDRSKIWMMVGIMCVMLIVQLFIAAKAMLHSNLWSLDLSNRLRMLLGNRLQKFSLGFFKQKDPGEITAIILQDVANFEGIFGHSAGNIATAFFYTAVLSLFLFITDWRLALCLLVSIPLIIPFLWVANYFITKFGKKQIAARNTVGAKFLEYVQGIRHLKSYGMTGEKYQALEHAFDDLRKKSIRTEAIPGPFIVTSVIIFEIGFLAMVALGLYYLTGNSITVPVLIAFLILGYQFYAPLKIVMVDYLVLRYVNESLKRIIDVLETPTMETGKDEMPTRFDIAFDNVSFGYLEKPTVKHLNFSVPERSMLALVGHSGSGKTTITSLIARFWDVNTGNIKIGGVDIRNINQDQFYSLISEVFQEVYLFDDTIYNNIKIGKPNATREEIEKAAEKAKVLDFALELPNGMDTLTGESGSKLSGGQKQRISIARALLKDAPIVLLDEATASLDPENEIYIQQAIQELVKSKTFVVIAHKLATIKNAQQIIVLDNGSITEKGTHQELLDQQGTYHRLWTIQQQSGGWKVKL